MSMELAVRPAPAPPVRSALMAPTSIPEMLNAQVSFISVYIVMC